MNHREASPEDSSFSLPFLHGEDSVGRPVVQEGGEASRPFLAGQRSCSERGSEDEPFINRLIKRPAAAFELAPLVFATGLLEPDTLGRRWMGYTCEICIAACLLKGRNEVTLKFRVAEFRFYRFAPPQMLVSIDGQVLGNIVFNNQQETAVLSFVVEAHSDSDMNIVIEASECFVPAQFGLPQKREVSFEFIDFQLKSLAQNSLQTTNCNAESAAIPGRLCWVAPVLNYSGYAQVARNLIKGLQAQNYPLDVIPLCGGETQGPMDSFTLQAVVPMLQKRPRPGSILVTQTVPAVPSRPHLLEELWQRYPESSYRVISTMFETDRIPECWVEPCNKADEVWVLAKFNLETFARSGVKPEKLRHVPFAGVDPRIFKSPKKRMQFAVAKGFGFLSIFEWTRRKGWDVLLRAYVEEFSPDEDVALNLFVSRRDGTNKRGSIKELAEKYLLETFNLSLDQVPTINIMETKGLSDMEMPGLYGSCDAFVLPSRGEGWGMPYLEAMIMGLPTVGTNWGGNLEFMTRDNSFLVDIDGFSPVNAEQVSDNLLYDGHKWAEPSCGSLREIMRYILTHREAARATGRRAKVDVFNRWTVNHAAERVIRRVEEIKQFFFGAGKAGLHIAPK